MPETGFENLNLDIVAVDNASKVLDNVISKLKSIQNITKSMPKIDLGKDFGAKKSELTKAFKEFQKTGEISKKTQKFQMQQGNIDVFKQAKKNIEISSELNNAQYKATRLSKLFNDEKRKSIDNSLKIENGLKKETSSLYDINSAEYKNLRLEEIKHSFDKKSIDNSLKIENGLKKKKSSLYDINSVEYKRTRLEEIKHSFDKKSIDNELKKQLGLEKTTKAIKSQSQNLKVFASSIAKYILSIATLKKAAKLIANAVDISGDWMESLNLFEVTMGNASKQSLDFANKLVKAYGIGSNQLIKYMGLFTQMTSAIGVQKDLAVDLGKTLTAVGIDIASFYNRTTESTMEMIRAAIAGQTKPARQYGFDITSQSLDKFLKEKGVSQTSKNLSQDEKALLRVTLILKQSMNAWGDMAKTINSFQNQMKILNGSLQNLKLAFGDLFIDYFTVAIKYLNAFIIAITNIIRLFKPLKTQSDFGSKIKEETKTATEGVDELNESLGLLNIDKFNVLSDTSKTDKGSAIGGLIQEEYLKTQEEYLKTLNKRMEDIKKSATDIAKKIQDWFVIVDENGGFKEWTAQAKILVGVLGAIGTLLVGIFIGEKVKKIVKIFPAIIKTIKLIPPKTLLIVGAIVLIIGLLIKAYKKNEEFRESVNKVFESVKNIFLAFKPSLEKIIKAFKTVYNTFFNIAIKIISIVFDKILVPILDFIGKIIEKLDEMKILEPILGTMFLGGIYWAGKFIENIDTISERLENLFGNIRKWFEKTSYTFNKDLETFRKVFNSENMDAFWESKSKDYKDFFKNIFKKKKFAVGGFPEDGMFFANHNEMVGKFSNGKTAVANNEQIVAGIKQGVYEGMLSAILQTSSDDKEINVNIKADFNGTDFIRYTQNEAKKQGYTFAKIK